MPSALWKSGSSPHPTLPEQGAVIDSRPKSVEPEADTLPVVEAPVTEPIDNNVEKATIASDEPQAEIAQVSNATKTTRKSKR